jgi:hypothetical protein
LSLDKSVLSRLSFIKYLFNNGRDQSFKPVPLCFSSLLTFHDAVELYLSLSAEFLKVNIPHNIQLMQYFDKINKGLQQQELTQKQAINRLNRARNSLKHHGILPALEDIEIYRTSITNFFDENTKIIYNISFSDIHLIELIQSENVKKYLKKAEKLLNEKKVLQSIGAIAIGFVILLDEYNMEVEKQLGYSYSELHFFSPSISSYQGADEEVRDFSSEVESAVDELSSKIEELDAVLRIISLGMDFKKYKIFKWLTPKVYRTKRGYTYKFYKLPKFKLTSEDIYFCLEFVIESGLILQNPVIQKNPNFKG